MRHRELVNVTTSHQNAIEWMLHKGYIHSNIMCVKCSNINMKLYWQPKPLFKCPKCTSTKSIFSNTLFYGCNKNISEMLDLVYFWCLDMVQSKAAFQANTKSRNTTVRWYKKLRNLSCRIMRERNVEGRIGGPGHVIQIDESKFSKRKFEIGRIVRSPWVVGMIDVNTREVCFVETMFRNSETLSDIIRNHVRDGSIIITDCWAGYNNLRNMNYTHLTVNHSQNFVDPITGANTQLIENTWGVYKRKMRNRGINYKSDINSYFIEFFFKKCFENNIFEQIMNNLYLI